MIIFPPLIMIVKSNVILQSNITISATNQQSTYLMVLISLNYKLSDVFYKGTSMLV